MRYNLGLSFNETTSQKLTQYGVEVCSAGNSSYLLGERSLPHVSILQFDSEIEPNEIKNVFSSLSRKCALDLGGLTYLPSPGLHKDVWVEITIFRSAELAELQNGAIAALPNAKPLNGTGRMFRPHITVAHFSDAPRNLPALPSGILRGSLKSELVLGISDEQFQMTDIAVRF